MNLSTLLVLCVLILIISFSVRTIIKDKKVGNHHVVVIVALVVAIHYAMIPNHCLKNIESKSYIASSAFC